MERQYPGRTESIFSALRNVESAHLADPRPSTSRGWMPIAPHPE